jgi:thymidylate synthase
LFGAPEFLVKTQDGIITAIEVLRGAPCGATWHAAQKMIGLETAEAIVRMGLEPQFYCSADPAGWDPINGKSPVHFAGNVHSAALEKAIKKAVS